MKAFDDFVNGHSGLCPELPLLHSTKLGNLDGIVKSGKLSLTPCAHFGRPLVYLFYGRPAYRPKAGGDRPDADFHICPISFIFKPARLSARIARAFPHDTGAALTGMFSPKIESAQGLDYEIQANVISLQRYVSRVFLSNEKYFVGEPDPALKTLNMDDAVRRFLDLIEPTDATLVDDRRYTAELQVDEDILLRDLLLAVVLPRAFMDREAVRNAIINDWGAIPLMYDTYAGGIPQAYYQTVKQKVLDFYREHRLL
jgi:hypothetical protein